MPRWMNPAATVYEPVKHVATGSSVAIVRRMLRAMRPRTEPVTLAQLALMIEDVK